MIKKRILGRTGLNVTECSLGTFHMATDFLTPHNEAPSRFSFKKYI